MFRRLFGGKEPPKVQEAEQPTETTQEVAQVVEEAPPPVVDQLPPPPQAGVNIATPPPPPQPGLNMAVPAPSAQAGVNVAPPPPVETERAPARADTYTVPAPRAEQGAPAAPQQTPPDSAPPAAAGEITYSSVAEYDAAMRAAQPEPVRRASGLRRFFGGEERPVEEADRDTQKTQQAIEKTRSGLFGRIGEIFRTDEPITEEMWDELEEVMIMGDVGIDTAEILIHRVRRKVAQDHLTQARQARAVLKRELVRLLEADPPAYSERTTRPYIILVVGVNGAGKTTLIAKMSKRYKAEMYKDVLLAAGDTFRAAAVEQLATWAERVGVPVITQGQGADPGAVAFDAMQATYARNSDILIIDTAGRLQSKYNLMQELQKIRNILRKRVETAPHEVLLVVDATTGQNGLNQAKAFAEAAGVTHLALTKLDGTAKGGIAFAMVQEIKRPIKYIGTGEKLDDLAIFDPQAFVDALFEEVA